MTMQLNRANAIAERIRDHLKPWTRRIDIAGSVRRRVADVGDIEIVAVPLEVPATKSLFGTVERWMHAPEFVQRVYDLGEVIKGNPADGRMVQIEIRNTSGEFIIKCDLFMPQYDDYFRQLAIRTGSATYSGGLARAWKANGWVGTPDGLRLRSQCKELGEHRWQCVHERPTLPPVWKSEQEFFTWLGIHWMEPQQRNA